MTSIRNKIHVQEYIYDFDVDGGAVGAITLSDNANKGAIPIGAIIKGVVAKVITDIEGDTSTVSWGTSETADGYSGTTIAEATLVADYVVNGWDNAASLLWDNSDDHIIYPYVDNAAGGSFQVTVAGNDLTAGKIIFLVEYYMPSLT